MPAQLAVIGVVVSDMARSLAFYRLLGIEPKEPADDQPHVEVELGGGLKLAFDTEDTIRSFDPGWERPVNGPGVGLAFACDDPADVDATFQTLVEAGGTAHLAPWDAFWGQRYAAIHDPDGNGIDLFAPLPSS